jgi:hypothetical protein
MRYAGGVELRLELPLRAIRFTRGMKPRPGDPFKTMNVWLFHGEHGTLSMCRNWFKVDPPELVEDPPDWSARRIWEGPGIVAKPHIQNWLDCVKSRGTPIVPVEVGHRSVTVCHLAGIARELGRRLRWDPDREVFVGDEEANGLLDRPRREGFELPG